MIFITVGSQKFQFNRLLETIDTLIKNKEITEDVFAQTGYSNYKPKNYKFKDFLDRDEFESAISKCSILVTHGGTGAIVNGLKREKKVIAVPRLKKYKEHVDDHQLDIAKAFEMKKYVLCCYENDDLLEIIKKSKNYHYEEYVSHQKQIVNIIKDFLEDK